MDIQFKPTDANIQTGAVQYNVQPNLTASRAFEGLQQGLLSGMKFQEQLREEDFRRRQSDLQNTMSAFTEDYAKASWAQKETMVKELEGLMIKPYGEDNRWDRALAQAGTEFKSRMVANLEQEREQRAREAKAAADRRAATEANIAYLALQQDLQDTPNPEDQAVKLAQWKTDNVDRYEQTNPELYARYLGHYVQARGYVVEARRVLTDNQTKADILTSVSTTIAASGGITVDEYSGILESAQAISDYAQKPGEYNAAIAQAAYNALAAQYVIPGQRPTMDQVTQLQTQMADLVKADPHIVNTQGYLQMQGMAADMQQTVYNNQLTDNQSMFNDPTVSNAVFEKSTRALEAMGLYSPEEANSLIANKVEHNATENQRITVANAMRTNDVTSLVDGVKNGSLNLSTVQTSVGDNLEIRYNGILANNPGQEAAVAAQVLTDYAQFDKNGVAPSKLPFIDNILKSTRSGELLSDQQIDTFLSVYESSKATGYGGINDSKIVTDYLALRWMRDNGIFNAGERLQNARLNPVKVNDSDLNKAFLGAIDSTGGFWTEGLNPSNINSLRGTLLPVIETLINSGVKVSEVQTLVNDSMSANYINADPTIGASSEVWIPRTPDLQSDNAYNMAFTGVSEFIKATTNNSLIYLGPRNMSDPTGMWMAVDSTGYSYEVRYDKLIETSKAGRYTP